MQFALDCSKIGHSNTPLIFHHSHKNATTTTTTTTATTTTKNNNNKPRKKERNTTRRTKQLSDRSQAMGHVRLYRLKGLPVTASSQIFRKQG